MMRPLIVKTTILLMIFVTCLPSCGGPTSRVVLIARGYGISMVLPPGWKNDRENIYKKAPGKLPLGKIQNTSFHEDRTWKEYIEQRKYEIWEGDSLISTETRWIGGHEAIIAVTDHQRPKDKHFKAITAHFLMYYQRSPQILCIEFRATPSQFSRYRTRFMEAFDSIIFIDSEECIFVFP